MFPIVGVGASAGGLAAFEALFSAMSGSSERGLHLAPDVSPSGFVRQGTGAADPVSNHGKWVLALLVVAALSTLGFAWKVWKESTQPPRP